MKDALHEVRFAAHQVHGQQQHRDHQQHGVARIQAEVDLLARDERDDQHRRDREADRREGGAQADVHRPLEVVVSGGHDGGHALGPKLLGAIEQDILANHADVLDETTFYILPRMNPDAFAIVDVSDLAENQGLSMNEIMEGDSQRKINNQANEEWETEPIDVTEFIEDEPMVDYETADIPEALEEYDPLHIQDFDVPDFDLYEIDELKQLQEEENEARNHDTEE